MCNQAFKLAGVVPRRKYLWIIVFCLPWAANRPAQCQQPPLAEPPLPTLRADLPHDVELADPTNPVQADFDVYSWKSFVALNWPANGDGTPNTNQIIGQDVTAKRVWEFYIHPKDVFLPGGVQPAWTSPKDMGAELQLSKAASTFRGGVLDALRFPVIDQNKNFILFDIRLNREEFDFIVANKLYSIAGQKSETTGEKFISFPSGEDNGSVGAVEIKTAWRIFTQTPADTAAMKRYYTIPVTIPINADQSVTGSEFKVSVTLGLVGFHIAHKTKGQPQWVWSTFEHIDNLSAPVGAKPTLTDPECTACSPNNRPLPPGVDVPPEPNKPANPPKVTYKWAETPPYAAPNQRIPTQIHRLTPLSPSTTQLNQQWQAALHKAAPDSVWQYYQLISTQWPLKPFARQPGQLPGNGAGNPTLDQFEGTPTPRFLANVPLETYNQSISSCIHCHGKAFTSHGDYADFSFLLGLAQ